MCMGMNGAFIALMVVLAVAMATVTTAQPLSPLADLTPGATECPLDRVAMIRGSDSEAREGGGFYAARRNGIHGALDLNGALGETVHAVANGKVIVAARSDWGKLGRTVVIDHRDGGYTVYGHLNTVEIAANSSVTAGQIIGTIGYSGNAASLRAKHLSPHLHFAYFRTVTDVNGRVAPLARIRESGEGVRAAYTRDAVLADAAGIVNPIQAVKFLKCWEDDQAPPATRSTRTLR
jgi:murein DD-endopeptidase MepM/ murein hydrolase activator NlpD